MCTHTRKTRKKQQGIYIKRRKTTTRCRFLLVLRNPGKGCLSFYRLTAEGNNRGKEVRRKAIVRRAAAQAHQIQSKKPQHQHGRATSKLLSFHPTYLKVHELLPSVSRLGGRGDGVCCAALARAHVSVKRLGTLRQGGAERSGARRGECQQKQKHGRHVTRLTPLRIGRIGGSSTSHRAKSVGSVGSSTSHQANRSFAESASHDQKVKDP